ncbi:MAG: ArsR family transcriptional regulator [bacterium]
MKFFLNSENTGYLRSLEPEFGESTNAIRQELNRFENAGLLVSAMDGKKKVFQANTSHPLFPELHNLLLKYVGIDRIIEKVIVKLGKLEEVYLVGDLARGNDSPVIDLWLVGDDIDETYLDGLTAKAEKLIKRKVRYKILGPDDLRSRLKDNNNHSLLLVWKA